ncbi:homoserine O-acetyltransferase [Malassezia sp. CBS 17886]|nr:homoserine O-acetyltransferase [Malassezia sp. CBS 17886]
METPFEIAGPTSPYAAGIDQRYLLVPAFELECGVRLQNAPVAFQTWGRLDAATRANVVLVCHPISGSANVAEWWGPLFGPGRTLDTNRFLVVCCNVIGSPYGTASPVTRRGGEQVHDGVWTRAPHVGARDAVPQDSWWGAAFPPTTVRDDVRLHKHVLEYLGVEQLACVLGGSMGGMESLEWPLCFPVRYPRGADALVRTTSNDKPYVRQAVLLASAARQSPWCIAWSEIQRRAIEVDPRFREGTYPPHDQPAAGLAAARMCALMTYRQPQSFERRFSRTRARTNRPRGTPAPAAALSGASSLMEEENDDGATPVATSAAPQQREQYAVQSYLHHQGAKFVQRFDALCYVHLTLKLDSHDASTGRAAWLATPPADDTTCLRGVLHCLGASAVAPRILILSVTSDLLYAPEEQHFMHENIPHSQLVNIVSAEGHDGFLLEYPQIERAINAFLPPPAAHL